MRKIYLDNIRWITVVLVVIYHVIYMYNSIVPVGVIGPFSEFQPQDAFQYVVYPWLMLLLFVVSGMCARFELEKVPEKEFLKKRTRKLLVPSTIGLFVFYWTTGYYNMAIGGAFETLPAEMPKLVTFLIMALSGTGPLWYIQVLWLFSEILVLIRRFERNRFYNICSRTGVGTLIGLTGAIWAGAQVLNTPVIAVYRFGIYGLGFLIGYFCLSHDEVIERLARFWRPMALVSIILAVLNVKVFWGMPYAESPVLKTPLCNAYAWISVLAILAFMSLFGNFENSLTRFMNRTSWGLYLFHYLPLAMAAYYMNRLAPQLPPLAQYLVTGTAAFAGAFALNAIIPKIPVLRYCAMGLGKKQKK